MDIKLVKTVIATGFILTLISCSAIRGSKDLNTYYGDAFFYPGYSLNKPSPKNGWVINYKQSSFYHCLSQGYKNDTIFKLIHEEDIFLEAAVPMSFWPKINSESKKIIDNLPSTEYYNDETDKNKKHILESCLCYFASRELDSVAKKAYKNYLKNNKNASKYSE